MILNVLKKIPVALIHVYQRTISPLLGNRCRFYPSCSAYAKSAFEKKSFFNAIILSFKRILKCHPLHPGGVDVLE